MVAYFCLEIRHNYHDNLRKILRLNKPSWKYSLDNKKFHDKNFAMFLTAIRFLDRLCLHPCAHSISTRLHGFEFVRGISGHLSDSNSFYVKPNMNN